MSRTSLAIGLLGMLLLVACAPTKHATLPAGETVTAAAAPAEAIAQPPAPVSAPAPAPALPPAPRPAPVVTIRPAPASAPAPSTAPASRPAAVSSTKPALPAKPAAPAPTVQAVPQPVAPADVASSARPAAAAPPEGRPPAAPALDVHSLETQLRETKAIGVFTKIALKNQVDDLLDRFRAYYRGESRTTLTELRQGYNLLLMKVLSLLQDGDPPLAKRIVESREAIWGILADPKKFSQNNLMAGG